MPCNYSRWAEFKTPTNSFMRQILGFPELLTLISHVRGRVAWEPGAWGLEGPPPLSPFTLGVACSLAEQPSLSVNVGKDFCPGTHPGERSPSFTVTKVLGRVETPITHQEAPVPD